MELQFPDALVPDLLRRFTEHGARLVPDEKTLRHLLSLAFYASLGREEGRSVQFALMLTEDEALRSRALNCWAPLRFATRRPATVKEVVKLAPATSPEQTFIALVQNEDKLEVAGLVRTNRDHTRLARYESQTAQSVDLKYIRVTAVSPGCFTFGLQHHDLARFANGVALTDPIPALHVGGPVMTALESLTRGPKPNAEDPPVHSYARVLLQALRETAVRAHGGAIVLAPHELPADVVDVKYSANSRSFDESVRAHEKEAQRLRDTDAQAFNSAESDRGDAYARARFAAFGLEQEGPHLGDAASALGDLTGVDGAVLIGPRFTLLGFGAMFREVTASIPAELAQEPTASRRVPLDLSAFGSRHRSVASFCYDHPGALGVVISQDGDASCFVRPEGEGRLLVWRPVPLEWSIPTIAPPTWSAAGASRGQIEAPRGWRAVAKRIREGWQERLQRSGVARRRQ